jgi:hypothetical protein
MNYLDGAREAARPYFGSEDIVAALPVSPAGTLRKRAVAGAAIGGGVGSAIGLAAVRALGSRTEDITVRLRISDRFVQLPMVLVLGIDRLGIFFQKPLRHAVGSFFGHVAVADIDGVFLDKIKFSKFHSLTLSFKDRSFVALEVPRRLHADQFAALIDESRTRPT